MALDEEDWDQSHDPKNDSSEYTEGPTKKRKTTTPAANTKRSKHEQHQRSASPTTTTTSAEETHEDIAKQYKKFASAPKYDLNSEELFCVCRKPDLGEMMVACDGCEEWFHFECMKVNPKFSELIAKYYCKFCEWKGLGTSQWKRKCRVEGCFKPIAPGSKYCSREHGLQFMKKMLVDSTTREDSPSTQELSAGAIKDIVNYVAGDYKKLQDLGAKFPELKAVVEYKQHPNSLQDFPDDVRNDLQNAQEKSEKVQQEIKQQEEGLETLSTMKENVKQLNEKLTGLIFQDLNQDSSQPTKKKKKKSSKSKKKVDLCLCDKSDAFIVKQIIDSESLFDRLAKILKRRYSDEEQGSDDEEEEEEEDSDWFMDDLCIKDKKKCARHNGWWNLYHDEAVKNLDQLKVQTQAVSDQKEKILRNYSVKVYES
ncbi:Set1 complex component spp1 [Candida viswanathii]|uniref:Set1 complex component spp1 n=1 Tax=Candida viswanathii TaxID=5486 RepID=A0A367Y7R9_9ASCO|nr:Set1 complex component spp1 [Candida viswanathii]